MTISNAPCKGKSFLMFLKLLSLQGVFCIFSKTQGDALG